MTLPIISLTQAQQLNALGNFLLGICAASDSTKPFSVVLGQDNRVPEPLGDDYLVMTPMTQTRLATNETAYVDAILTGSIAGNVLTVATVNVTTLGAGQLLIDTTAAIAANTIIVSQLTGPPGGAGTYTVSISQTVGSETMYAGLRQDAEAAQWSVQLDVHGPLSADNARVIETLFRSEYATSAFAGTPYAVTPLYCSDPRQMPFVNENQQIENRWTLDAQMQIAPVVTTPQDFAAEVEITVIQAAIEYTGP